MPSLISYVSRTHCFHLHLHQADPLGHQEKIQSFSLTSEGAHINIIIFIGGQKKLGYFKGLVRTKRNRSIFPNVGWKITFLRTHLVYVFKNLYIFKGIDQVWKSLYITHTEHYLLVSWFPVASSASPRSTERKYGKSVQSSCSVIQGFVMECTRTWLG